METGRNITFTLGSGRKLAIRVSLGSLDCSRPKSEGEGAGNTQQYRFQEIHFDPAYLSDEENVFASKLRNHSSHEKSGIFYFRRYGGKMGARIGRSERRDRYEMQGTREVISLISKVAKCLCTKIWKVSSSEYQ